MAMVDLNPDSIIVTGLSIDLIRMDGDTQSRHGLIHEKVDEYARLMADAIAFPPVTVFYDGSDYWLADGFHRCHAAKKIENDLMLAAIKPGTRRDAKLYAMRANTTHGAPLLLSERKNNAKVMLEDEEWSQWSDRKIAEQCGLDHKTVGRLRGELSGEFPQIERLVERNGTVYTINTSNIGQRQPEPQPETEYATIEDIFPGDSAWKQEYVPTAVTPSVFPITEDVEEEEDEDHSIEPEATVIHDESLIAKEQRDAHVMRVMGSSDSPEWYTPQMVIERVLNMFGSIDTDPCSNSHENPNIPARVLYTKDDDGLAHTWYGKTYLNPPYGSEIGKWINKLIADYEQGHVEEALALLPARIDTVWFQPLYAFLMCNVRGRIQFANSPYGAPFPCVIVYLGKREHVFIETFKTLGPIMRRIG